MNKNDVVQGVRIADYGSDGGGVARVEGRAVFVSGAARGDLCDLRIVKVARTHAFAIVESLIEPSADRVANDCPYYPKCGGCDTRHISYAAECGMKRRRASDALERIGGVGIEVPEVLPSRLVDGYRNKGIFQVSGATVGLFRRRSHDIVEVSRCRLQADGAAAFCDACRALAASLGIVGVRWLFYRQNRKGEASAAVVARDDALLRTSFGDHIKRACPHVTTLSLIVNDTDTNVVMRGRQHLIYGDVLVDTLLGLEFEISPFSFFQVNREQAEKLYRLALDFAEPRACETVLDLYCGIGTLSLAFSAHAKHVTGAEIVADAVRDAAANAARNHIENARFICADASDVAANGGHYDVVLLDPPRSGVTQRGIEATAALSPSRIVYVSCDAATLARDIARFAPLGYTATRVSAVDMFPRTAHVECVARLERNSA